jgi:CRISPR/Cas system CSM-associated protein Csm2 small subunit
MNTKDVMKLWMNGVRKIYTNIAEERKKTWKKVIYGFLGMKIFVYTSSKNLKVEDIWKIP